MPVNQEQQSIARRSERSPFSLMRRFQEDMDRMFEMALGGTMGTWSPAIEVKQQGDKLQVCAELPGLKPEEVQIEATEDALTIQGERRQETSSDEGGVHRTERHYGRFYRSIPLPPGAKTEQASASFKDGVLEITVPVPEEASRRRRISIGNATERRTLTSRP